MGSRCTNNIAKFFKEGADIEISSKDVGFIGSWYPGTVIQLPGKVKKSSSKVFVEYRTLMDDLKGKRKLRERIDLVQIRPIQPSEGKRKFNVSEDVDVYVNEGWWEGIVTEVVLGDEYEVFFKVTRDKMVSKGCKLRLHREWVHGKWFPPLEESVGRDNEKIPLSAGAYVDKPEKEQVDHNHKSEILRVDHNFKPGAHVEVSNDEDGLEGALFGGTVVTKISPHKYLIKYDSLMSDDNSLLIEKVDSVNIRPYPPEIPVVDGYSHLEIVDAYYNDAWWAGVISKVLRNDKYSVYFKKFDEESKFEHSKLRVHQDWIDGKWVIASKAMEL